MRSDVISICDGDDDGDPDDDNDGRELILPQVSRYTDGDTNIPKDHYYVHDIQIHVDNQFMYDYDQTSSYE